ncbi:hypothetical protein Plhal304r1_c002g0008941 [Plasmopara halstedii]
MMIYTLEIKACSLSPALSTAGYTTQVISVPVFTPLNFMYQYALLEKFPNICCTNEKEGCEIGRLQLLRLTLVQKPLN